MSNNQTVPEGKDPILWEIACKRVGFIKHAVVYLIVNIFLWALWYFTSNDYNSEYRIIKEGYYPWPIWTTLGWGIGLAFNFTSAYIFPRVNTTENEYQKLVNKK